MARQIQKNGLTKAIVRGGGCGDGCLEFSNAKTWIVHYFAIVQDEDWKTYSNHTYTMMV